MWNDGANDPRMLKTLENLEISGNLLILENSGKTREFTIYSGNFSGNF